jgi:hypothetical protein
VYETDFPDETTAEYATNLITTVMFARVDNEGQSYQILDEIMDHCETSQAIPNGEAYVMICGKQHPLRITRGWEMGILWKNGDTSWESLKDMKEANLIKTAEYAIAKGIGTKHAFNWWVQHTLKKQDSIIWAAGAQII